MSEEESRRAKRIVVSDDEEEDAPVQTENNSEENPQQDNQDEQVIKQDEENQEAEGMDDLFGDDDDEQDQEDNNNTRVENDDQENNSDNDDVQRYSDQEGLEFAVEQEKPTKEPTVIGLDVVRHPPGFQHEDEKLYYTKIPNFLQVDPTRFDGKAYLEELVENSESLSKDDIELNRLKAENTIRWRYAKDSNGELIHESNAQVIEWSDGSLSLKLGDEYFDIYKTPLTDTFLTTFNEESGLLGTDGVFTDSLKLVPTSTNSKIHKKLTNAVQATQFKPSAQSVFIDKDPDQEARRLEKQQEQLIRERRRKELKEQKEKEKYDTDLPRASSRVTRESYYAQPKTKDEYEEDDFMVEDDEDLDEDDDDEEDDLAAAERLRRVKNEGAAKYQDEDEDDQEVEEDDEDSKSRKKRRVIEDSDDDE
ncbi:Midasin [Wickerhamomyces ciferrii]|uniref:Midasin n=1 Tax=Wickerhamomyces ciferrii (strain ATCC 14091 / BCRC 22168 / CBS 111 / JCM 3599 / NBRC 0793 / NRRL Y-1031 F-60-10) TaxID=1206466 RepID=K0KZT0_WICCF|nr:Midasin [Wickerhamomyces ciferrii]CCH46844.1 Midasin [Wickerhamomyces ciferrii]